MQSTSNILLSLKSALGLKTDIQLAELLKINSAGLSAWKRRNSLNHQMIIDLCEAHGISLDVIFSGHKNKATQYNFEEEKYKDKYLQCLEEKAEIQQKLIDLLSK